MPPKTNKVKGGQNEICLPFDKYFNDPEEEETYKLLGDLIVHNMGSGYTCFIKAFALFTSTDQEIKIGKSTIIKFFDNVNSIEKFEALGLPIKKITKCPDSTVNVAYEIDLT